MDRLDWILILLLLQFLALLGILVLLFFFWLFLQGYAAAGTHAMILRGLCALAFQRI